MDLLSLILAAALASGLGGATPPDSTNARAHIIDVGAQSSSETPPDTTDGRATIIELGNQ